MSLDTQLEKAAIFLEQNSSSMVRIVSHLDCDGICACAIIVKALLRKNINHSITIVPQLESRIIDQLADEDYSMVIFTDLGSGQLQFIKNLDNRILILDHHRPQKAELPKNVLHVNPSLFGIDGSREISGAGVAYLFARKLDERNEDLAWLAVVGALGDSQENKGFRGINAEILDTAVSNKSMLVKKGLRLHGSTKPLHRMLELSFDPLIPGVTGNYKGSMDFLNDLGIEIRKDGRYRTLDQLSEKEKHILAQGIIDLRFNEKDPEDIYGNNYIIKGENSQLADAREMCTALNACGRLGKSSVGVSALLGDNAMKKEALGILQDFRKEIVAALSWADSHAAIKGPGYVIINAKENIMPTMAGTICSMIARSNKFAKGTIVMMISRTDLNTSKVSLRIAGRSDSDLRDIIKKIVGQVGGEAGGHRNAAGAIIKTDDEKAFINASKRILSENNMEELI